MLKEFVSMVLSVEVDKLRFVEFDPVEQNVDGWDRIDRGLTQLSADSINTADTANLHS